MSKIEWTERTWNPIAGCSKVSAGCKNCYAETMAKRLVNIPTTPKKYNGTITNLHWSGVVNFDEKALLEPLRRKKPTMYFVNSMSDLFHYNVPFEWVDKIMAVIALCPQHTFQVLTKRPERMKEYFDRKWTYGEIPAYVGYFRDTLGYKQTENYYFPLQNLWLGVSVENQDQADKRIPYLLETPAKIRFLSCEPLLEEIKFRTQVDFENQGGYDDPDYQITDYLKGSVHIAKYNIHSENDFATFDLPKIDWVIVGGESGANARPMHPDWVRSIRDQCLEAGVPFFFKQWGGKTPKKRGDFLDGKQYHQFPK